MATNPPLLGVRVVNTRPRRQSAATQDTLTAAGASVLSFPVLDVVALPTTVPDLSAVTACIFVSANAVEHGLNRLLQAGLSPDMPVFAIGDATARALADGGMKVIHTPMGSIDSEGLLAHPALDANAVGGKFILLVKGDSETGGRGLIQDTLTARGVLVHPFCCYRRERIAHDVAARDTLHAFLQKMPPAAVLVASVESLDAFLDALPERRAVFHLLLPHARIATAAAARGFSATHVVPLSADALVDALSALKPTLWPQNNVH